MQRARIHTAQTGHHQETETSYTSQAICKSVSSATECTTNCISSNTRDPKPASTAAAGTRRLAIQRQAASERRRGATRHGAAPPAAARRHAALYAPPRVTTRHRAPPHAKATQRQNAMEISSPLGTMMVNTTQEKLHCRLQSHCPCHCVRNKAHTKARCSRRCSRRAAAPASISARGGGNTNCKVCAQKQPS